MQDTTRTPGGVAAPGRIGPLCRMLRATALALGLGGALGAHAAYPEKPIQLVISFPPAGASDVMARAIGQKLGTELQQSIIVENRPGAGGAIGMSVAARAAADGYTLYQAGVTNLAIAASVYKSQQASLPNDFVPVATMAYSPHMLVVPATLPVNTLAELIDYVKKEPGRYNFASQGTGTLSHLESELLMMKTGMDMVHVPYKGSSQALPDVINGSSVMFFDSIPGSIALVKAGKLKVLAVASAGRSSLLPDVPTFAEAGVPGIEANNVFAMMAPKGTPQPAIDAMAAALQKVLAMPDLKEKLSAQGIETHYAPAGDLARDIADEYRRWGEVVKAAGIEPQ